MHESNNTTNLLAFLIIFCKHEFYEIYLKIDKNIHIETYGIK